jgi:glutamate carboxypeptidase
LCGTGPVGGNAHTDEEWCRIDTIVPRAQALALTILEVAASPPRGLPTDKRGAVRR